MHALIIEDQPFVALMIEDHLRDLGFGSFDYAVTESEAVANARRRRPDLITSDVQLAQGCGVAAVQTICQDKPIPVVFITATASRVHQRMSDAVIVRKPFSADELTCAVAASGCSRSRSRPPGPRSYPARC